MAKISFNRRFYHHPKEFFEDFNYMMLHRQQIRRAVREVISPAFRERLMMVFTEVTGCRYCSYFHAGQSLKYGVSQAELKDLLAGSIPDETPPEEYLALTYAQHWASENAHPDAQVKEKIIETYGKEKADAIEIVLRMIRIGNLMGNTIDYFLFRISFGLLGVRKDESRFGSLPDNTSS